MNPHTFTAAVTRLSHCKLGLKEATVLLNIATGYDTNKTLVEKIEADMTHILSRTGILKRKGLIKPEWTVGGRMHHVLTTRGANLVKRVLTTSEP